MRYTDVVFDVDGTLVDSEWAVLVSLQRTLEAIGRPVPPAEELTFVLGITGQDALRQMGVEDIPGTFDGSSPESRNPLRISRPCCSL